MWKKNDSEDEDEDDSDEDSGHGDVNKDNDNTTVPRVNILFLIFLRKIPFCPQIVNLGRERKKERDLKKKKNQRL